MRLFKTRRRDAQAPSGYLCSDRALYWIEHTYADRAVLEDCRNGVLVDVPVSFLHRLRRIDGKRLTARAAGARARQHADPSRA